MSCEFNLLNQFEKDFSKKDIQEILKHAEAVIKSKKGVKNFSDLMDYVIKKRVEHLKNRERYLKQIEKKSFLDARLTEFSKITKFTPSRAKDLLESYLSRNGLYQQTSLESNIVAKYNQYMEMVFDMEKTHPEFKLLRDPEANPEFTKILINELYNYSTTGNFSGTTPSPIKDMAKKFHDINQQRLHDLQSQGFDINDLKGYIYSGSYDPSLVRQKGIEYFTKMINDHVDVEATAEKWEIDLATEEGKEAFSKMLRDIYETVSTKDTSFIHKSSIEDVFEAMKNPSKMQNSLSRGRVFQFKNGESFHTFFTEFSGKNFLEAVHRDIRKSAKAYSTAEMFGTSPIIGKEFMFKKVNQLLVENGEQPLNSSYKKFYDHMFEYISGNSGMADNLTVHIAGNVKKTADMALLGKAPLRAAMTDPIFSALEQSKISHNSYFVALAKSVSKFIGTSMSPEKRRILSKRFSYLTRAMQMETLNDKTVGAGKFTRGLTAAHNFYMRATGANFQAVNMRIANMAMTAQHISDVFRGKAQKFAEADMNVLRRFGFNEKDFEVIKRTLDNNKDADFIDPNMIRDLDEATLRQLYPEKKQITVYNEDLDTMVKTEVDYDIKDLKQKSHKTAQLLSTYLQDSAFLGSPTPTKVMQAYMSGMTSPETTTGALMQLITMYKAFPLTVYRVYRNAAWHDGIDRGSFIKQYGRAGIAKTMVTSLAAGATSLMILDIIDGKTPRDPTSKGFIFDAMMAGSAGGLWADYLMEDYEQGKKDIVRDLAGPVMGRMLPDIFELYGNMQKYIKEGDEEKLTSTFINISRWIPAQNLWITNSVFGNLVLNDYREWADPKFAKRRRKNMKKMSGELWEQKQLLE